MRRPLPLVAVLFALALGGAAGAQGAPPGTLPVTPDPAECGIAPREAEELAELTATPDANAAGGTGTPFVLPPGEPADAPTVAFVNAIVREALACGNASGFLGVAALLTNEALAHHTDEVLTFAAGAAPPADDERRALLDVIGAREVGNGRLGALVVITDPTRTPATTLTYVVLAEGAEGAGGSEQYLYLIDDLVEDPYGLTENGAVGTPAA